MSDHNDDHNDDRYDYVVVGGGTAGSLIAARLSEDGDRTVALVEWGPDDRGEPRARSLRRWAEMLEGEYDLDYRSVAQERGNSDIRHARMRILGGCSNANTMISWRPLPADLEEWVALGADGWDAATVLPYYDRLQVPIQPVASQDRNPYVADVVAAAAKALGVPVQDRWNDGRLHEAAQGAGFFEVGYTPESNQRGATSLHYLHPAMDRPNLSVLTGLRVVRVLIEDGRAAGVEARDAHGGTMIIRCDREVVVCCGGIDSPRLLQLSGIGPARVLGEAGVEVVVDLPGVGENLQDHAEGLVVWESAGSPPPTCASGWDAGAMLSVEGDPRRPDVLMHFPVEAWAVHAENHGAHLPEQIVSIAPNVAKPASRGRVAIVSADPGEPPLLDPRYFTDPDGHDERMLLAGIRAARRVAEEEPFRSHLVREVFPGPDVVTDEQLSEVARATHQTVYHVCGTCRMGAGDDPMAVVDPRLRVRGVEGLRVADASVFPTIPSVNPVVTVMLVAERAADLIRAAGRPALPGNDHQEVPMSHPSRRVVAGGHVRIRPFNTKDTYPEQNLDNDLCQAVVAGNTVYVRGQIGQDLDTSESVGVGDVEAQTERAMANIDLLLKEAGSRMEHLVKLTIYLVDPRYREAVYRTIGRWTRGVHPISTGLVVSALARPEWLVEVDAIAVIPEEER